MKILIAPDKFKGSLNAAEVCDAITKGIKINKSKDEIISCPMADGGEGSIDIINNHLIMIFFNHLPWILQNSQNLRAH